MLKKLAIGLLALVLAAPLLSMVGIGLLMNPALSGACTVSGGSFTVGEVPDELAVQTRDGEQFTLNKTQLTHAATIIEIGSGIDGVNRDGLQIALMAALTESTLRQLANTSAYPESGDYPNDGDGSDNDSLGLFQMRPQSGWGTVADLMDTTYQAEAFFGGPDGPNGGSPRGLLDIPGWEDMGKGEAAQAVEVSAHPERYENYSPVAIAILDALIGPTTGTATASSTDGSPVIVPALAESSRVVFPLPEGTWTATSPFGYRTHPITGERKLHTGADFSAADGTPILAAADGTVTVAEFSGGYGGLVVIEHTIGGATVATAYAHSWEDGIHVTAGDRVTAGQHIADVGSSGMSTGPHLHFEVRDGGTDGEYIDPAAWLNDQNAADLPEAETGPPGGDCDPETRSGPGGEPDPFTGDNPDELVDDPTTDGQITRRTLHLYQQTSAAFPDTTWACYSPRPGSVSEHPLGRACDIAFGNAIGQRPTPAQREQGWEVTNWMKTHAEVLGVEYLIWDGKIWSLARDDEGWRDYNGGGMHDPGSITGGHFDHSHVTVADSVGGA
ncbi:MULTISPECIES: M23 family metallopeptidase [Actinomycetes]|uniref:M23 family metallopeptidase n=1 Tax=Actinomycetes TaxID=1760 RepID=UPI00264756F3|nr:M23 family metallopeptidase [Corynebacterium sp.]MDN5720423.1 M23 family metallopeptidase [Corynebacterium sp.]MDN6510386.1 M23 family metallopeptidase [Corynebacterium sp.]